MRTVCPICGTTFEAESAKDRPVPFCSQRCREIDLGRWLDMEYRIPAEQELPEDDLGEREESNR